MRISHSTQVDGSIDYHIISEANRASLGDIQISIGYNNSMYLTLAEAFTLLSVLEAAAHEVNQRECSHPMQDIRDFDGTAACSLCGREFPYASDENVL